MPFITYPTTLPGPGQWSGQPLDRAVRSPSPGNTQLRNRSRDTLHDIDAQWFYTSAEMSIWRAWYEATLLNGMLWFAVTVPGVSGWVPRVVKFRTKTLKLEYIGNGVSRVSAQVQQRGVSVAPNMPESVIVDVNASQFSGLGFGTGLYVTGFDASRTYTLSLPSGRLYTAWSPYPEASAAPPGVRWHSDIHIYAPSTGDQQFGTPNSDSVGDTAEAARLAFPGGLIGGSSEYWFWMYDTNSGDNLGGLSIQMTPA